MTILVWCILTIASAILYRMGGAEGFNTKWRDLGVPACAIGLLWFLSGWNWMLTGLGYSISMLPYSIATHHMTGFWLRTVILTTLVTVWSVLIDNDVMEECGRGAFVTATIPLLLC